LVCGFFSQNNKYLNTARGKSKEKTMGGFFSSLRKNSPVYLKWKKLVVVVGNEENSQHQQETTKKPAFLQKLCRRKDHFFCFYYFPSHCLQPLSKMDLMVIP